VKELRLREFSGRLTRSIFARARENVQKGQVGWNQRGPIDLSGSDPADGAVVELTRLSLKGDAAEEMEGYIEMRVAVFKSRKMLPDGNGDPKLLLQFPAKRLLAGLSLLDLASRKLPISGHITAIRSPAEQAGLGTNKDSGNHLRMRTRAG